MPGCGGRYSGSTGGNTGIASGFLASVAASFGFDAAISETQYIYDLFIDALGGSFSLFDTSDPGIPKAYMNWLLFDTDFVLYDYGFSKISTVKLFAVTKCNLKAYKNIN